MISECIVNKCPVFLLSLYLIPLTMKLFRAFKIFAAPLLLAFVYWGCRTHEEKKPDMRTCYSPQPKEKDTVVHKDTIRHKDTGQTKVPLHPCYQPPRDKQNQHDKKN